MYNLCVRRRIISLAQKSKTQKLNYRMTLKALITYYILCLIWTADAINNAAGFGFNGYDSEGEAQWDLISNLRISNIEVSLFPLPLLFYLAIKDEWNQRWMKSCCMFVFQFATSFKMFLDNWNIQTAHWLKR